MLDVAGRSRLSDSRRREMIWPVPAGKAVVGDAMNVVEISRWIFQGQRRGGQSKLAAGARTFLPALRAR